MIEALGRLMKQECGFLWSLFGTKVYARFKERGRALEPFLEIFLGFLQRLGGRKRLRFGERMTRLLEQHDTLTNDVHEEIAPEPELLVHIVEAVIDQADRCAEIASVGQLAKQFLLGPGPEFGNVSQLLAVNHHEQIIVGEIAADRILDPVAARIAAEQDDLEQAAATQPRHGPAPDRERKTLAQAIDDKGKLVLLCIGEMVDAGLHATLKFASRGSKNKRIPPLRRVALEREHRRPAAQVISEQGRQDYPRPARRDRRKRFRSISIPGETVEQVLDLRPQDHVLPSDPGRITHPQIEQGRPGHHQLDPSACRQGLGSPLARKDETAIDAEPGDCGNLPLAARRNAKPRDRDRTQSHVGDVLPVDLSVDQDPANDQREILDCMTGNRKFESFVLNLADKAIIAAARVDGGIGFFGVEPARDQREPGQRREPGADFLLRDHCGIEQLVGIGGCHRRNPGFLEPAAHRAVELEGPPEAQGGPGIIEPGRSPADRGA